jgi:hypothetical protein
MGNRLFLSEFAMENNQENRRWLGDFFHNLQPPPRETLALSRQTPSILPAAKCPKLVAQPSWQESIRDVNETPRAEFFAYF